MFTFDDLVRVDGQGVQVLVRSVPKEQLLLALKGASENLRDLFFKNMSERAGKMFKEDLANLGPVRLRDVDEAQAAVVMMAKDLAAQGQITLQEGREDEMVY
jgi:flagellar motor switch protein FliG